jgi:hypothetical protein
MMRYRVFVVEQRLMGRTEIIDQLEKRKKIIGEYRA